jgi:hypothetical protein
MLILPTLKNPNLVMFLGKKMIAAFEANFFALSNF